MGGSLRQWNKDACFGLAEDEAKSKVRRPKLSLYNKRLRVDDPQTASILRVEGLAGNVVALSGRLRDLPSLWFGGRLSIRMTNGVNEWGNSHLGVQNRISPRSEDA